MTYDCLILYNYDSQKKRGDEVSPRTGRPTENPKPYKITVRINEDNKKLLDEYCKQENVSQMEAVRRGIDKLESEIKK